MEYFDQTPHNTSPKRGSRVKSITIWLCVTDCTGTVYFTDLLLQGGSVATGWIGHICESRWTLGE